MQTDAIVPGDPSDAHMGKEGARAIERNLGIQPIVRILSRHGLQACDLVAARPGRITFKMVSRACKGRRLTPHVQERLREALNQAASTAYSVRDLFTY